MDPDGYVENQGSFTATVSWALTAGLGMENLGLGMQEGIEMMARDVSPLQPQICRRA